MRMRAVSEKAAKRREEVRVAGAPAEPDLADLEWVGCHTRRMTTSEYDTYEGRIEFFDSRTEMAVFANEAAHLAHEGPRERLPMLLERIAMLRGSPIVCLG